ncbi:golgin subfamily B member 1 [Microcaecilia unicolor]|uniref:Golgin subfamily B member 1-like n=1 Tax=Microcaecilia unicolor TaxID=1415580 RepID=A0A6P7Y1A6_9AMPH|nr:golgin subfamily B member 1-like [Microcaecilia unicolor]XP_030056613.1 golgin subfamily B member 1-like [Microcaecilia unicolor]XP_030056614.1 golgin subfamily B member 1-like [Microcaecilia unicolor]
MWKWYSGDESSSGAGVPGTQDGGNTMSVGDMVEQLAQTEQLVVQLKELIREKDNELRNKDQKLKEEKEASEVKLSKAKLQNKAKVASLSSQLEELKKQLASGSQEIKVNKKTSNDGDQENAAANRGKILMLRRKVEELESQISQKNEELHKKNTEIKALCQRGSELDAMLVEKDKKLAEKEAYIIDLQIATGSSNTAKEVVVPVEDVKAPVNESSVQEMQSLIQSLTWKMGDHEERYSLLQEQNQSLKNLFSKEKQHFQEREAMYVENIRVFQNIIQEREKDLMSQAQKHEQELFKLAAKSDASADLEQLLKALKQKLHEKEEVLLGRNQVIDVLQKELDSKDQQLKEINDTNRRLHVEKENLQSKLEAEKHVMRAQLRDMREKHENELKKLHEVHAAMIQEIQEKHELELQEKDQAVLQLQKRAESSESNSEQALDADAVMKQKVEKLKAQVKIKTDEASKSEAKFLKIKAWSKSRIKQLEDELKSLQSSSKNNHSDLTSRVIELENEKEELQSKLELFSELRSQNEELLAKLEIYEEQQRKLQADLEQVTKRAASQTSESGSVDELQNRLLEWQEMVPESEDAHDQVREEKLAIALRMAQIEEEREGLIEDDWFFPGCSDPAIVSGQQVLEEELTAAQGITRLHQAKKKSIQATTKHQEGYDTEDSNIVLERTDSAEGENMGGWWPEFTSPNTGLRTVVEELELERNQLQEQILLLEERCQNLEDQLQLQVRVETLQNENERLQTQLTQLRSQHSQEADRQQILVSSLNEQLKGINDRKVFLETSLMEKEQKLLGMTEKLEHTENLRQLLQEKDILNKELSEKLAQTDQQLDDMKKKLGTYEMECSKLKSSNSDLIEKVATFKEKVLKQDEALEFTQRDLDQTNEELDRLNTSHMEERTQLIHDLQRLEREIDNLKEILLEKDNEISAFSSNITEYSEQILILKQQVQFKEEEVREMENALAKSEKESDILREAQSSDIKDASSMISALSQKLNMMELELNKTVDQKNASTKEAEELIRQISENNVTIKELRTEIQAHTVTHNNRVTEYESQITLLKGQVNTLTEKLKEAESKHRQEIENLRFQLDENNSAKERLNNLLEERENKEQTFERELKSMKDQYNKLVAEAAKKDEDLDKISKQLEKHIQEKEIIEISLQKKTEIVTSLEEKLQVARQQNEETKLKLMGKLKAKVKENKELQKQLDENNEIASKVTAEKEELALTKKHLQSLLEEKEVCLAGKIKVGEDLSESVLNLGNQKQQLVTENEHLLKQLNVKESEILTLSQTVSELGNKIFVNEKQLLDCQSVISKLTHDKNELMSKVKEISINSEQKETLVTQELMEKTKESHFLSQQLSENTETMQQLHEQIYALEVKLKDANEKSLEKEDKLNNRVAEYNTLLEQLSQNKVELEALQQRFEKLTSSLEEQNKTLDEKSTQVDVLHKQQEENKKHNAKLENEGNALRAENAKLMQSVEEKDSCLKSQGVTLENLNQQVDQKTKESILLSSQLEMISKETSILKFETEGALVALNKKSNEYDSLLSQVTQYQSENASLKQEANKLNIEMKQLKADIEMINSSKTKKENEIDALNSHLSQERNSILALKEQIDMLIAEKQNLQSSFAENANFLAQKEALIQQIKENKLEGEGKHMQVISDLQNQLQDFLSEASRLKQTIEDKENELKNQAVELKLFKDKSEESVLLKVQLCENMEVISDLHGQIKALREKIDALNQLTSMKDEALKQKVDDYVNLKAQFSDLQENCVMQQEQLASLRSESDQLKTTVLEKELAWKNNLIHNEELQVILQNKETTCEALRQKVLNLEEVTLTLEKELNDHKVELSRIQASIREKETLVLEKTNLLKNLNEKASNVELFQSQLEEKTLLVSQLQGQMHSMTLELQKFEELRQEKENMLVGLQENLKAEHEKLNKLTTTVTEKEDYVSKLLTYLKEKDSVIHLMESNIHTLTSDIGLVEVVDNNVALKNIANVVKEGSKTIAAKELTISILTAELESMKTEHQKAREHIQVLQQKEIMLKALQEKCTDQSQEVQNLKSEQNNLLSKTSQDIHEKTVLLDNLQVQFNSIIQEKVCMEEERNKAIMEKEELADTYRSQLNKKSAELEDLHKELEHALKDSVQQVETITMQMKSEKDQLQIQVSVQAEEIAGFKGKIELLEQSLIESERKLGSISQQNAIFTEQLSRLESEMTLKNSKIQVLQQDLDLLDSQLTENVSVLFGNKHFSEKDAEVLQAEKQLTDCKPRLKKLSFIMSIIVSKETEVAELRQILSKQEKYIDDITKDKKQSVMSLEKERELLQSDIEKVEKKYQSEVACLLEEIASVKQKLEQQQLNLEKKEEMLEDRRKRIGLLQEQLQKLESKLKNRHEKLDAEGKKILGLLEEMRKKECLIESLTSQTNQQKDLVTVLSHQLKEKDISVTQVMESMSNQMIKFSDEKNMLISQLQCLESVQSSSLADIAEMSQKLMECKKQLEHHQFMLADKDTMINDLVNEKDQMQFQVEKLSKEKDNMKKKLQAALLVRKDLMKKVESGQNEIEKKGTETEELMKTVDELTCQLKSVETCNRELTSHLELLKQQLLEKDSDVNALKDTLLEKESLLEQLENNIKELRDSIANKEFELHEYLTCVQKKDSLLDHVRAMLSEKDRAFGEVRSQLLLQLENFKASVVKQQDKSHRQSVEQQFSAGDSFSHYNLYNKSNQLNVLQKENEAFQKQLEATHLERKAIIKKAQKEKDKLLAKLAEQTSDLDTLKKEHSELKDGYKVKCKELDHNQLVISSLQKELQTYEVDLLEKETVVNKYRLEVEEQKGRIEAIQQEFGKDKTCEERVVEIKSEIIMKNTELDKLNGEYLKLLEETKLQQEDLLKLSIDLAEKTEETIKLKNSFNELEQNYKKDKDVMLTEIFQLQKKVEISEVEIADLKEELQLANKQISEKNDDIAALVSPLQDQHKKFEEKDILWLQKSLRDSQEEVKHFKTICEDLKRGKEETASTLLKLNAEMLNLKTHLNNCKENAELLTTLNPTETEKGITETLTLCRETKENYNDNLEQSYLISESKLLQETLLEKDSHIKSLEHEFSRGEENAEDLEHQIQQQTKMVYKSVEKKMEANSIQQQGMKNAEVKSKEPLQRKLQAALMSHKEVLKENKLLKERIDCLLLANSELANKASTLECTLSELFKEKESITVSLYQEKGHLSSENERLITDNENLSAACESLKSTMETIVQEKEAFSFQLNSLKDSQTVELSEWKAKHSELNKEYESLLQAYENISNEIGKMSQIIELTRREKQDIMHQFHEIELEKQEFEKQIQKINSENENLKSSLKQLAGSKQEEINELNTEVERLTNELKSTTEGQSLVSQLSQENSELAEENNKLKETSEVLQRSSQQYQNENEILQNDIHVIKYALGELQVQMDSYQTDMQARYSEIVSEKETLTYQINLLNNEIAGKMKNLTAIEQEKNKSLEKLKESKKSLDHQNGLISKLELEVSSLKQNIISLNEKVRILEDDKCLLQEELENVQETSCKIKYERELLQTDLLNNKKMTDHLTGQLKAAHMQTSLLAQQIEDLKTEKCSIVREKEEQHLQLVREFEVKVKSCRGNHGAKSNSKELQDLLKEKQQEISQLQKDSIKFQELILDLEISLKVSLSKSKEIEKDLSSTTDKLAKANREVRILDEKLYSHNILTEEMKHEISALTAENLKLKRDIQKKEDDLKIQKRNHEKDLENSLQDLKITNQKELMSHQDRHDTLQREKDRIVEELHQTKNQMVVKDLQNKTLQGDLNTSLARLAAFTQCMSSLQNDRDRVVDEMKKWEIQFKNAIENKEKQVEESQQKIIYLQEEIKSKVSQLQELEIKCSMLEGANKEISLQKNHKDAEYSNELTSVRETNVMLLSRLEELEMDLRSKEDMLQTLYFENDSLKVHVSSKADVRKQIEILENTVAQKEEEFQQEVSEKEKLCADLENLVSISQQMKVMLNNKDTEISMLLSSKDGEISGYLEQIQSQHRKQIGEYEKKMGTLRTEKEQLREACRNMENELKLLQAKADKAVQDKKETVSESDAFRKSMSSLQADRDHISDFKDPEHYHQIVLSEKDNIIVDSAGENSALKQELRNLLNQIDDLHAETAMLRAQLIRYREDLNQVLSLKDHQLKELLKQKLDHIKNLEQEKCDFQKQKKEIQKINASQKKAMECLERENENLKSKINDLEVLIAALNKIKLISESKAAFQGGITYHNQKKELIFKMQDSEALESKFPQDKKILEKIKESDGMLHKEMMTLEQLENERDRAEDQTEKGLLDLQLQNKTLIFQIESFGKAMAALQDDRDRLIEDFKILQSRYASELRSEKIRGDDLETELKMFKSRLLNLLTKTSVLKKTFIAPGNEVPVYELIGQTESLCKALADRDLEITRLSSECGNQAQQIDAFSKAMASLQDDRERLLQHLSKLKIAHDTKQGISSVTVVADSEFSSLKSNLEHLQNDEKKQGKDASNLMSTDILELKSKVNTLEKALQQAKTSQDQTVQEISLYQSEMAELRMEKNLLVMESQALRDQFNMTVSEKDQQIADLQKLQQGMVTQETSFISSINDDKVRRLAEENSLLASQLKTLSQMLRETQMRYSEMQNHCYRLEREYQAGRVSFQETVQDELRAEVPPGAPQEKTTAVVEMHDMELGDQWKRLLDTEQKYDLAQQEINQLIDRLSEERIRRETAEENLKLAEEQNKSYRAVPQDHEYAVQVESDEEREALIINPSEHIVKRKMKGGALSFRRWLRGRSLYFSKLLTSRAKSRYLFLIYLLTLHIIVIMCLSGIL